MWRTLPCCDAGNLDRDFASRPGRLGFLNLYAERTHRRGISKEKNAGKIGWRIPGNGGRCAPPDFWPGLAIRGPRRLRGRFFILHRLPPVPPTPVIRYPADLPVSGQRDRIVAALREHQVLIVAGETGSGKTTQLPKMCLEAGLGARGRIGCTQPRRVAAMSISKRVAEEMNVPWGGVVGCKMRF
ncbi:MAG: hrpB 1, partial [Verrucomicrobiales bacterium]|nr:hrpB 1 [Verrucomicrobiales bacterium]